MDYSTVACSEVHGSLKEEPQEDGVTCSVKLRVPFANRWSLVSDILSNRRAWPHLSGWANPPRAKSASIEPMLGATTTSGQALAYEDSFVLVTYSTKVQDLVAEELEPISDFRVLDFKRFRWGAAAGDPLLEAEAPGKLHRSFALSRTLFKVNPPVPAVIRDGVGGVNDALYSSTLLGIDFDEETLLFNPPRISRTIKSDGTVAYTLAMKWLYREEGWNKYWRAKTDTYEEIWDVEGAAPHKSYPPTDFTALLS